MDQNHVYTFLFSHNITGAEGRKCYCLPGPSLYLLPASCQMLALVLGSRHARCSGTPTGQQLPPGMALQQRLSAGAQLCPLPLHPLEQNAMGSEALELPLDGSLEGALPPSSVTEHLSNAQEDTDLTLGGPLFWMLSQTWRLRLLLVSAISISFRVLVLRTSC